jgi:hypothetical protein
MLKKLTIDETWDYTKRMWKWIAFQKFCGDERDVIILKKVWLEENALEFVDIAESCFFCEATIGCSTCPGKLVDDDFYCMGGNNPYQYYYHPGAFYREILRLDAIRTAKPVVPVKSEHEWVHGDVFRNVAGIQIYLEPYPKPIVVNLGHTNSGGTPEVQLPGDDTVFLFNIRDIIKDKL